MKAKVDVNKCEGHARCAAKAPELFILNDDSYMDTPEIDVPKGMEKLARLAARACPEGAITIVDDD